MIKVGLTGNIGSGKTTISNIFKIFAIPVYDADSNAKKAYNDELILSEIQTHFGNKILDETKHIDFKKIAEIVFAQKNELEFLNNLIHPFVFNDFTIWCETNFKLHKIAIVESAILFESGFNKFVDKSILIVSNKELQIKRIIERDKTDRENVIKRMQNQWNEEIKIKLSDFIIYNDEKEFLTPQILKIIETLHQFC